MGSRPNHVVGKYRGEFLIRRDRRDDICAGCGAARVGAPNDRQAEVGHVALELLDGVRVDIEDAKPVNAKNGMKGARLKLRLSAKADQRHCLAVGPREMRRRQSRGRAGSKGGGERHVGDERRIAGLDIGERAEGDDGLQVEVRVAGMTVDEFKGESLAVARRHQFDDAARRMARVTWRLLERVPAHKITTQIVDEPQPKASRAHFSNDAGDISRAEKRHHAFSDRSMSEKTRTRQR